MERWACAFYLPDFIGNIFCLQMVFLYICSLKKEPSSFEYKNVVMTLKSKLSQMKSSYLFSLIMWLLYSTTQLVYPSNFFQENDSLSVVSTKVESDSLIVEEDNTISKNQRLAITYLNHISAVLANIEEYNNKQILTEEYNSVWENSTIEQLVGFPSVAKFQNNLLGNLQLMILNSEDCNRLRNKLEKKKNQAARDAMSSALNGVYLVGGNPYSIVANVVLATARTAVDYSSQLSALDDEFSDQTWQIEKQSLITLTDLRKESRNVAYDLFSQHSLLEKYRINDDIKELVEIIHNTADNPLLRASKLELKVNKFRYYAPYWYYLGDAYMNIQSNEKALMAFDEYEKLYNEAPIFRKDKYLGIIAANKLQLNKDSYSEDQVNLLVDQTLTNLPTDGNMYLFCAINYFENLHDANKGMDLLYKSIMDNRVSAKDETILYLTLLLHNNPSYGVIYKDLLSRIDEVISKERIVLSLPTFSRYLSERKVDDTLLGYLNQVDITYKKEYYGFWWWIEFIILLIGIIILFSLWLYFNIYTLLAGIVLTLIGSILLCNDYNSHTPKVSKIQIPHYIDISSEEIKISAYKITDENGIIIYDNAKFSFNTGYTKDEIIQKFYQFKEYENEILLYFKKMPNGRFRFRYELNLQEMDSEISDIDRMKIRDICRKDEKVDIDIIFKKFKDKKELKRKDVDANFEDPILTALVYGNLTHNNNPKNLEKDFKLDSDLDLSYLRISVHDINMLFKKSSGKTFLVLYEYGKQLYFPSYISYNELIHDYMSKETPEEQENKKSWFSRVLDWIIFWK